MKGQGSVVNRGFDGYINRKASFSSEHESVGGIASGLTYSAIITMDHSCIVISPMLFLLDGQGPQHIQQSSIKSLGGRISLRVIGCGLRLLLYLTRYTAD